MELARPKLHVDLCAYRQIKMKITLKKNSVFFVFENNTLTLKPQFKLAGITAFTAVNRFRQTNFRHLQNIRKQSRKMNQSIQLAHIIPPPKGAITSFVFEKINWNETVHHSLTKFT